MQKLKDFYTKHKKNIITAAAAIAAALIIWKKFGQKRRSY
jgi:hypothetical protein